MLNISIGFLVLLFFVLLSVLLLLLIVTLQRKSWRFIWQLNGLTGIVQQPILWALLLIHLEPKNILTMICRWRGYFRRPLAIIFGTKILLYVDDPQTIEQVLNAHECLDKTFLQDGFFARKGLLHASAQQWKTRRKQLSPAFSPSILHSFLNVFNTVGNQLQCTLLEKLQTSNASVTATTTTTATATIGYKDVEDLLSRAVLEVSCLTMLSEETDFTKNDAAGIASAYKKLLEISALRIMKPWLQCERLFRWLDYENYEEFLRCNKLVQQFVKDIVERKFAHTQTTRKVATAKSATVDNDKDSDIANEATTRKRIFIEQIFHLTELGEMTLEDVMNETHSMILVSFETVSNSLIIALLLLSMHPDCQQKLRNEINVILPQAVANFSDNFSVVGIDVNTGGFMSIANLLESNVTQQQLQQMEYLDMIVNESLRLLTTVPINLRNVSSDFWLRLQQFSFHYEHQQEKQQQQQQQQHEKHQKHQKHQKVNENLNKQRSVLVPRDTIVVVDAFNMHRDSRIWGTKALKFEPEEHFGLLRPRQSYSFIPFSKGLRSCIGSRYSLLLMKVFLVKLISSFEFRTQTQLAQLRFVQEVSLKFQHAEDITFQLRKVEVHHKVAESLRK